MMKNVMLVTSLMLLSNGVFAKVNCKPFKQEVTSAQAIVDNFQYEVEKLEKKAN
jgi:hypothetical protein